MTAFTDHLRALITAPPTPKVKPIWSLSTLPKDAKFTLLNRVQFRFPRTKNRRIRKKWAKRAENWKPARKPMYYHFNPAKHVGQCTKIWDEPVPCLFCEDKVPLRVVLGIYNHRGGFSQISMPEVTFRKLTHRLPTTDSGNINVQVVKDSNGFYKMERE